MDTLERQGARDDGLVEHGRTNATGIAACCLRHPFVGIGQCILVAYDKDGSNDLGDIVVRLNDVMLYHTQRKPNIKNPRMVVISEDGSATIRPGIGSRSAIASQHDAVITVTPMDKTPWSTPEIALVEPVSSPVWFCPSHIEKLAWVSRELSRLQGIIDAPVRLVRCGEKLAFVEFMHFTHVFGIIQSAAVSMKPQQ